MVAISLYRGNLHKHPNAPRRWTLPTPKMSPKNFKTLTRRRAKALARLQLSSSPPATNTNPNHDPDADPNANYSILISNPPADIENDDGTAEIDFALTEDFNEKKTEVEEGEWEKDGGDDDLTKLGLDQTNDESVEEKNVNDVEIKEEPQSDPVERHDTELATSEKDKMIKEIEGKLEVLNQKKHNLVQVLKLILSAEEQMKQNSVLGTSSGGPTLPLEADTPRDGVETDDCLNQNEHSPSLDSQNQKPASDMVEAVSPLCFVPVGGYITSSPSPAASGGTSAFRDVTLPSPLN